MQAQQMTDAAKEARRAYHREWTRKNPDKVKAAQQRFYERVAERMKKGGGENGSGMCEPSWRP